MRGAVAALGLVLAGWPLAAVAQVAPATAITPDTAPGRGLGTTVSQSGRTFTIDGGARAGANLFHSFAGFDLGAGDTARWARGAGDGGQIANVVNRVTGGTPSHISGVLDSTALPNATFWFVNPAGIVFGAGAQVNVPSAAYFSTAAELRFADGARFAAATPNGSTLSMAAPEAFGFVGGQGTIAIQDVGIGFVPGFTNLTFAASDLTVTNTMFAAGGLDMVAVGNGAAAVPLADPLAGAYTGALQVRNSTLNAAAIDVTGGPFRLGAGVLDFEASRLVTDTAGSATGQDLILKADSIRIGRDSFIITSSRGAGEGGEVQLTARNLVIDGTDGTTTTGVTSVASAGGAAGAIRLTANNMLLAGNAFVGSTVSGDGDAGDVLLTATNMVLDTALISSASLAGGDGGDIRLRAETFELGAANIVTSAFGAGMAGDVIFDGRTLFLSGGSLGSTPGGTGDSGSLFINLTGRMETEGGFFGVSTFTEGSAAAAGTISIRASELVMHQTLLNTQAGGLGAPGQVLIDTGDAILDEVIFVGDAKDGVGQGRFRLNATGDIFMRNGFFTSNANGLGAGGIIEISGHNIDLVNSIIQSEARTGSAGAAGSVLVAATERLDLNNTQISSSTSGDGKAGDIRVKARAITLDSSSTLRSDTMTFSTANAGAVSVAADNLSMEDLSEISSQSRDGSIGDAGQISIDVGRLSMTTGGFITSTTDGVGAGGTVTIRADEIFMDGETLGVTAIASETLGEGRGGNVTIAAKKLTLDRSAIISTISLAADAGNISLDVGELSVLNGSKLATFSNGAGRSGDLDIKADKMEVRSDPTYERSFVTSAAFEGGAGDMRLQVGSLLVDYGLISSDTLLAGDAGSVNIDADTITLRDGSISSNTSGFGDAGSIAIRAKSLTMEAGTLIISAATIASDGGNAGSISVAADKIVIGDDAGITASTLSLGEAGVVDVRAKSLRLEGGYISSSAELGSTGSARDVHVVAEDLTLVNGGSIDTLSANPNKAGEITITTGSLLVDGLRSVITSENFADGSGDAGKVLITADNVRLANGGAISTNSAAGAAGDIEILVKRPGLVILEGEEFPGFILTSSGPGTGGIITISDPLAVVSNGASILALGEQGGANVRIQSRYFIRSTDRLNRLDVAGEVKLETGIYDVSSGTVAPDLSVLDASKVLRGQCPAARSTGAVSQLITRPVGPYAREPLTLGPSPAPAIAATTAGACS